MADDDNDSTSILGRPVTRRAVIGGSLAAASVAVAYAALGDKLNIFPDNNSGASTTVSVETDAFEQESVRISHLLRRAGFGASREEYDRYISLGLDATLNELINYSSVNDDAAVSLASKIDVQPGAFATLPAWWLARMANTRRPLQEKMTLFWHGLLTSQISEVRDPLAMQAQNELYRSNAMGRFPDILRAVTQDAAMMEYLDIAGSSRISPNENYARELMELFALGEGNYTEQDVREAARAFTGWAVPRNRIDQNTYTLGTPIFRPNLFDNGTKTFLGRTGNFRGEDIVDIVSEQPASARYIVRRLFDFFVYPEPSEDDIEPFVAVYNSKERSAGAVVEAMLSSDVFYSPRAYRAIIKSPIEYSIGAVKALGMQVNFGETATSAFGARGGSGSTFTSMGQTPFEPPNVAGWPGNGAWLNSATIFARLNYINQLTGGAPANARGGNTPRNQPAPTAMPTGVALGSASQALDYYLPLVVDDNISAEARQALLDYAGGPDAALSPDQLRGLVYLILGAPQFHLA